MTGLRGRCSRREGRQGATSAGVRTDSGAWSSRRASSRHQRRSSWSQVILTSTELPPKKAQRGAPQQVRAWRDALSPCRCLPTNRESPPHPGTREAAGTLGAESQSKDTAIAVAGQEPPPRSGPGTNARPTGTRRSRKVGEGPSPAFRSPVEPRSASQPQHHLLACNVAWRAEQAGGQLPSLPAPGF